MKQICILYMAWAYNSTAKNPVYSFIKFNQLECAFNLVVCVIINQLPFIAID